MAERVDRRALARAVDQVMIRWFEDYQNSAHPVCWGPLPGNHLRDEILDAVCASLHQQGEDNG